MSVGVDNVMESNDVGILHLLEERDLANGGAGNAFIFCFQADLLQRYYASSVCKISGFVYDTVCAYDARIKVSLWFSAANGSNVVAIVWQQTQIWRGCLGRGFGCQHTFSHLFQLLIILHGCCDLMLKKKKVEYRANRKMM